MFRSELLRGASRGGPRGWSYRGRHSSADGWRRGSLFSEINDNSVAIILTYGTARAQLAGDTEAREEYMARGPYMGPFTYHQHSKTTHTLSQGFVSC
jgi:hypothetical protein